MKSYKQRMENITFICTGVFLVNYIQIFYGFFFDIIQKCLCHFTYPQSSDHILWAGRSPGNYIFDSICISVDFQNNQEHSYKIN